MVEIRITTWNMYKLFLKRYNSLPNLVSKLFEILFDVFYVVVSIFATCSNCAK